MVINKLRIFFQNNQINHLCLDPIKKVEAKTIFSFDVRDTVEWLYAVFGVIRCFTDEIQYSMIFNKIPASIILV